jgi:hypothetical protein
MTKKPSNISLFGKRIHHEHSAANRRRSLIIIIIINMLMPSLEEGSG